MPEISDLVKYHICQTMGQGGQQVQLQGGSDMSQLQVNILHNIQHVKNIKNIHTYTYIIY